MFEYASFTQTSSDLNNNRDKYISSQLGIMEMVAVAGAGLAHLDSLEGRGRKLRERLGEANLTLETAISLCLTGEQAHTRKIHPSREHLYLVEDDLPDVLVEQNVEGQPGYRIVEKSDYQFITPFLHELQKSQLGEGSFVDVLEEVVKIFDQKSRTSIMFESLLLTSVAQFELFIARMCRAMLRFDSKLLTISNRQFSFDELSKFPSMEAIFENAVTARVDALMHRSLDDWLNFLREPLQAKCETDWASNLLQEIFLRRNVHVHAGGAVSALYLQGLRENPDGLKPGDELPVNESYLKAALDSMAQVAIVLTEAADVVVRNSEQARLMKDLVVRDLIDADYEQEEGYGPVEAVTQLLASGRFAAVAPLSSRLERFCSETGDWNYLLAYSFHAKKALNGLDSVRSEIEQWDFTGTYAAVILALVKRCLLDEIEEAIALYEELEQTGVLNVLNVAAWPVLEPIKAGIAHRSSSQGATRRGFLANARRHP